MSSVINVSSEGPSVIIDEQTRSESGEIEVAEEFPTETQNDWVISIKDKLEQARIEDDQVISIQENVVHDKVCIYRVPNYMVAGDESNKSYYPQTVSIGPYHHGKPHLAFMELHKWRVIHKILKRMDQGIEIYIKAMAELEEDARACYQGPVGLSSKEFIQMLLLDGCFILEIFRGFREGFPKLGYAHHDPVFVGKGKRILSIKLDMLKLENQLPLFVLDKLLELQFRSPEAAEITLRVYDSLLPHFRFSTKNQNVKFLTDLAKSDEDIRNLHCLLVVRQSLLQRRAKSEPTLSKKRWGWCLGGRGTGKYQQQQIHSAKELRQAAIKCRRRKNRQFWDIRFKNGYLKIPKLLIHKGTQTLFSNLIAFEECQTDSGNDVSSYVLLMANLTNSLEAVSYLRHHGIIVNYLDGDSKVLDLFSKLISKMNAVPKDSYLALVTIKINRFYYRQNKYCKKWNAWKRSLKNKYFDSPWAFLSFVAAVTLLILTFSQSYFAAYAYIKSP